MIIWLTVMPIRSMMRNPSRNDVGMASPTIMAERKPSAEITRIITKRIALVIDVCSVPIISKMKLEMSNEKLTLMFSGQSAVTSCVAARMLRVVSTTLAPMRLVTSIEMVGVPLKRA